MEEEFYNQEMVDGVRFSWNYWPCNKVGQTRVTVPVGALYTPLKEIENLALVQYEPVACEACKTILNPFCTVDYRYKTWTCTSCPKKNNFKSHYAANISEQ